MYLHGKSMKFWFGIVIWLLLLATASAEGPGASADNRRETLFNFEIDQNFISGHNKFQIFFMILDSHWEIYEEKGYKLEDKDAVITSADLKGLEASLLVNEKSSPQNPILITDHIIDKRKNARDQQDDYAKAKADRTPLPDFGGNDPAKFLTSLSRLAFTVDRAPEFFTSRQVLEIPYLDKSNLYFRNEYDARAEILEAQETDPEHSTNYHLIKDLSYFSRISFTRQIMKVLIPEEAWIRSRLYTQEDFDQARNEPNFSKILELKDYMRSEDGTELVELGEPLGIYHQYVYDFMKRNLPFDGYGELKLTEGAWSYQKFYPYPGDSQRTIVIDYKLVYINTLPLKKFASSKMMRKSAESDLPLVVNEIREILYRNKFAKKNSGENSGLQ